MIEGSPPIPTIDGRRFAWVGRLRANELLMGVARNTGWLLGDRLVRAALGFLVGAWVARYLGPDRFGHFAYVLAFIAFFQAIANLGADSIVVRDVAREPESAPEILGSILRFRFVAGLVCWAAAVGLMALLDPGNLETVAMTAIIGGVLVFQAADTVDLWFQSQMQSRRTVVAKLTAYLLTNGLKIVLVLTGAPLIAFAAAFLFDFAGAATALWLAYRRLPTARSWNLDLGRARTLLVQSWPFMLSGLAIVVYLRIDQLMLKALRGNHELGVFAAALPISQLWQMIPMTLAISFGPYVAQQKRAGEEQYEAALAMIFRLFGALAIAAAIVTIVAAPIIVPAVYGPDFAESVSVLQILVLTNVFMALGVAQTLWVTNEGVGRILLIQTIFGAAVAITGNIVLIPRFGAIGAAMAAVAANACAAFLVNMILAPRIFRMQLGLRPAVKPDSAGSPSE